MNARELSVLHAALEWLHAQNGAAPTGTVIQLRAFLGGKVDPRPGIAEFRAAMDVAEGKGWIVSVPAEFSPGDKKYSLTDAGEAALLRMTQA